ncbi:MAG: acylneuraminate cytidylyltransferase family protein [Bacteroidales bacterium]
MEIYFLLPMKGNSERVPDKNMKLFAGKPLYHSVLNEIIKVKYTKKIFINTDSERIAEDVRSNFPEVNIIKRPVSLQGDEVSMNRIIDYDISKSNGKHFFQTHSTNPLLKQATIETAIEHYFNNLDSYDSSFAVTRVQTRLYWASGEPVNHNPRELIRTQDLPLLYEENSNFYIFSKISFYNADNQRIGLKPYMFETPPLESIDIDDLSDFNLALQLKQITS